MTTLTDLMSALGADPRIDGVTPEAGSLLLAISGEAVHVAADGAHRRTVLWIRVRRVAPAEVAGAALAARRHNASAAAAGHVMALYVEGTMLILGTSLDGDDVAPADLAAAAVTLRTALDGARGLLDATLARRRRAAAESAPLPVDIPLIRV